MRRFMFTVCVISVTAIMWQPLSNQWKVYNYTSPFVEDGGSWVDLSKAEQQEVLRLNALNQKRFELE